MTDERDYRDDRWVKEDTYRPRIRPTDDLWIEVQDPDSGDRIADYRPNSLPEDVRNEEKDEHERERGPASQTSPGRSSNVSPPTYRQNRRVGVTVLTCRGSLVGDSASVPCVFDGAHSEYDQRTALTLDEPTQPPPVDHLTQLLDECEYDEAAACLEQFESVAPDDRKAALQALRSLAEDRPAALRPLLSALEPFLTDDVRAVRLTTAKLFVAVAETVPEAVVPLISSLADRLADEDEFYYVRARSAEALGYVALERPEKVASPELVADLRIGLSFDEPEVKEKLAKALEYVALGDPDRLRHQVSSLAAHLDDQNELVRYHLCTALVVIGCEYPAKLVDASEELTARLADENENPYVRGRAAEALGLLGDSAPDEMAISANDELSAADEGESFVANRVRFARNAFAEGDQADEVPGEIGTVEGIRRTTDEVVDELTAPDGVGECPHCGLPLPENGPPMCPQCGAPY